MLPFGEYESFEDCVAKNQDKDDPAAYCAVIQRQIEGGESTKLPFKLFLFAEAFNLTGNKVSGIAIHPKKIWHPEEGKEHVYLQDELKKAATTLAGKSFGIDHLRLLPKPNVMEKSWWDEQQNGVAFEGTVSDDIAQKIKEGAFKGLSIELDWFKPGVILEKVNGLAPRNFDLTSVHFLTRFPPGDKDAYVKLWEQVIPIVPPPLDIQIESLKQMFEERLRYLEGQVSALTRTDAWNQIPAPAIIIFKEAETKIHDEITQLRETLKVLDRLKEAYINDRTEAMKKLATIETDKTAKEAEFKTTIKTLKETFEPPKESEIIIGLRKELYDAKAVAAMAESKAKNVEHEWQVRYNNLHKMIFEALPPPHAWLAWKAGGPKIMVQRILNALGVKPNEYYE